MTEKERRIIRFLDKVGDEIGTGCWYWRGTRNKFGYGRAKLNGVRTTAHRVAYILFKAPVSDELDIDHLCRCHLCVNPDHLEAVSPRENNRRGFSVSAINARKVVCIRGHQLSFAKNGSRMCKICMRASQAQYRERLRTASATTVKRGPGRPRKQQQLG